jgi:hypothetical protein
VKTEKQTTDMTQRRREPRRLLQWLASREKLSEMALAILQNQIDFLSGREHLRRRLIECLKERWWPLKKKKKLEKERIRSGVGLRSSDTILEIKRMIETKKEEEREEEEQRTS